MKPTVRLEMPTDPNKLKIFINDRDATQELRVRSVTVHTESGKVTTARLELLLPEALVEDPNLVIDERLLRDLANLAGYALVPEEVATERLEMKGAIHDAEVYLETAGRHEALGRRVEALLASEEPPEGLRALYASVTGSIHARGEDIASEAWAWFREQILRPAAETFSGEPGMDPGTVPHCGAVHSPHVCARPVGHPGSHASESGLVGWNEQDEVTVSVPNPNHDRREYVYTYPVGNPQAARNDGDESRDSGAHPGVMLDREEGE